MYAASGILILCRWQSCALAKGSWFNKTCRIKSSLPLASAQDGHLQRMRIPEAAYMYK